jgi:N-acetylmuramoyl-L-alanine amidase
VSKSKTRTPTPVAVALRLSVALLIAICLLGNGAVARACSRDALRVGIDVGHSPAEPGATSARGRTEYEFNRRFAEELIERAKASPMLRLVLLNPSAQNVSLVQRPQEAARRDVDLLLSIHHDSANRKYMRKWEHNGRVLEYADAFRGFSLFVWGEGSHFRQSLAVATLIGKYLRSAGVAPTLHHAEPIPGENRQLLNREFGIYAAPFAVLKHATMPAALLEVGVIANRAEERELEEPSYRARLQSEVLNALVDYCSKA